MMTNPFSWFDPAEVAALAVAAAARDPASPGAGSAPAFAPREKSLQPQCAEFVAWVTRRIPGVRSVFLTDADGLPILGTEAAQSVVAAAAALMSSVLGVNVNLQLQIDQVSVGLQAGEVLQLVFVPGSGADALAVGLVTAEALRENEKSDVRAGLRELAKTIVAKTTGGTND